jgi:hypothetical protein
MDLEEQRLKHRIQERETALRKKVDTLKDRLERIKRLGDVNFLVGHHPGLTLAGSVVVGFLVQRFTDGRNRHYHSNGAHRTDSRNATAPGSESAPATRRWEPVIAVFSAVATRAAIGLIGEIGKKFVPWRHRARQSGYHARNNDG